jgi:hypothetical protein
MARRVPVLLLLAFAPAFAQDAPAEPGGAEPGPIPPGIVHLGRLRIVPHKGNDREALAMFLAAHAKHEQGDLDGALHDYLVFLGMPGRHDLPRRYLATVRGRVDTIRAGVAKQYAAATELYRLDRAQGLVALDRLAEEFAPLPEGRAAHVLGDTDRLRAAIDAARPHADAAKEKKQEAAAALEKAVRAYSSGLYLYEAKKLLLDLGGPDLFEPGEKVGGGKRPDEAKDDDDEDDEGVTIEVGDG